MSPALLERYLSAARTVTRLAVGRPPSVPAASRPTRCRSRLMQDDRADERLPFGSRGGAVITPQFPCRRRLHDHHPPSENALQRGARAGRPASSSSCGSIGSACKRFTVGGAEVKPPPASFAGTLTWNPEWEQYANHADERLTATIPVKAARARVGLAFVNRAWEPEDVLQPPRTGWGSAPTRCSTATRRSRASPSRGRSRRPASATRRAASGSSAAVRRRHRTKKAARARSSARWRAAPTGAR